MSFDENTQTTNVGSRDWLEASKNMRIRGYLPPAGRADFTPGFLEQTTQLTATGYEIPVPIQEDVDHALDMVSLPVKTPERAS